MASSAGGWSKERRWIFPLLISILILFFLVVTFINMGLISSSTSGYSWNLAVLFKVNNTNGSYSTEGVVVEEKVGRGAIRGNGTPIGTVPRLAYLVSGSKGDGEKLWRTLRALYHPRNLYLVHLDLESPAEERLRLAWLIGNDTVFQEARNVLMIAKANMVTYRGPTMVSNTLHACALLLRMTNNPYYWDWFINLSASDYPLVTQDDLLYTFSTVPKDMNFVEHTSRLGWKADARARPLIVDPGLYSSKKTNVFFATQKRELPSAFKLFTGSAWMALTREFVEYMVWGYDNLPRTLLMYYSNFISSPEGYFHTVLCNAPTFNSTVANHDLHYIRWDNPPRQHPRLLNINDFNSMVASNLPFARKFPANDPVLDKIDAELLRRRNGSFTPGGWCTGEPNCTQIGNVEMLRPGPGAQRLAALMAKIAQPELVANHSCL